MSIQPSNTSSSDKVPELRFPEFQKEWSIEKLGVNFEMKSGDFVPAKEIESEPNTNLYPCYGGNGLRGFTKSFTHEGRYNLIGRQGALCGNVNLVEGRFHATEHAVVVNNIENFDVDFIYYILNNLQLNRLATGQAQPGLSISILNSVKFYSTQLPEQQKIATFLTAIDQRIQLLQQKKAKLEEYKKGVMQKLFTQEIRFKIEGPDGKLVKPPDWEEKRLGEICEKQSSNISANSLEESGGDYKIYGATGFLQFVDFFREEEPYISIVKDGAGVGRILLCEAKSSVLGTLDILKPKGENNIHFLYALISTIRFEKYTTGSTIPHIYFKDYSKEKISVPTHVEQNKIASFLTSLDDSIKSLEVEIDSSIVYKKGLLQKMFV